MNTQIYGTIINDRVGAALSRIMPLCQHDWIAVIRSIDSTIDLHGICRVLTFHRVAYDVVCNNVCLSIANLQQALNNDVFTGFDEVWIIDESPQSTDLSQFPFSTSDGIEFSNEFPVALATAMNMVNCIVILGDGCGLNYATLDERFRELIVNIAIHNE